MDFNGNNMLTAGALLTPLCVMLWYFFSKWIERMDRMETKLDDIKQDFSHCVTREEHDKSMNRIHQRVDEHLAEETNFAGRLAHMEGIVGNR